MKLKDKLEKLEAILKQNKASVFEHFNLGLPKHEVEDFLSKHGIPLIPSLVALYQWHNGVKTVYGFYDYELEIMPFGKFFNLQEMISMRQPFKEWASYFHQEGEIPSTVDFTDLDNYIPLLGSGESDMFLLNLTTEEILLYQPMIQIFGDLEFCSIPQMLDCIIECFEKNIFTISDGNFDADFNNYRKIREEYSNKKQD